MVRSGLTSRYPALFQVGHVVRVVRVHVVTRVAVVGRVGGGRGVARRRATQGSFPGMGV